MVRGGSEHLNTTGRWKNAQEAELRAAGSFEGEEPLTTDWLNRSFSRRFGVDSSFLDGKSVLEVGCSPAGRLNSMQQANLRVGLDPLSHEWRHFYPTGINIVQGMGEFLPFTENSFDVVLCLNVLDHVDNPRQVLKEMHRCLKDGGSILLWLQTYSTLRAIRRVLDVFDLPHPHHFGDENVRRMMEETGVRTVAHKSVRKDLKEAISPIKNGLILSGLKSLLASLFLGLHDSSFLCRK